MRAKILVLAFGVVMLLSLHQTANASESNSVSFTYGYLHGSLEFPEEAHPTDSVICNLTIAAYIDVTIYNLTLAISGLVGQNRQTLRTEQILSYSMAQNETLSRQVTVIMPQNISEELGYIIEASTDKGFGRTSFNATIVRTTTYDELSTLYDSLLINRSKLQTDYDQLTGSYSVLNSSYNSLAGEYDSLQTTYNSLNSTYGSLNANHTSLESSHNSLKDLYAYIREKYEASTWELGVTRNLMYIFGVSTVVLAAATVYFRKKAPYIVLRKETAVEPKKE